MHNTYVKPRFEYQNAGLHYKSLCKLALIKSQNADLLGLTISRLLHYRHEGSYQKSTPASLQHNCYGIMLFYVLRCEKISLSENIYSLPQFDISIPIKTGVLKKCKHYQRNNEWVPSPTHASNYTIFGHSYFYLSSAVKVNSGWQTTNIWSLQRYLTELNHWRIQDSVKERLCFRRSSPIKVTPCSGDQITGPLGTPRALRNYETRNDKLIKYASNLVRDVAIPDTEETMWNILNRVWKNSPTQGQNARMSKQRSRKWPEWSILYVDPGARLFHNFSASTLLHS